MSTYKADTEMYINPNKADHTIFDKWCTLGSSSYTDKYRTEIRGNIEGNKVFEYYEYWDEETEDTIENRNFIKECADEKEAIEFAKQYFGVTKIITI